MVSIFKGFLDVTQLCFLWLLLLLVDGLGADAGQMVELVYLYGNTSTHHAVTITVYSILYPKKHGGYSTYVGEKIKRGVEGGAAP